MTLDAITEVQDTSLNSKCRGHQKGRLRFVDKSNPKALRQDAARLDFCRSCQRGGKLGELILTWLGDELSDYMDEDGSIDLAALIGKKARVTVKHHEDPYGRYEHPFCEIVALESVDDCPPPVHGNPFSLN